MLSMLWLPLLLLLHGPPPRLAHTPQYDVFHAYIITLQNVSSVFDSTNYFMKPEFLWGSKIFILKFTF